MIKYILLFFLYIPIVGYTQTTYYPMPQDCENYSSNKECFYAHVQDGITSFFDFTLLDKGEKIKFIFEVSKEGSYSLLYCSSSMDSITSSIRYALSQISAVDVNLVIQRGEPIPMQFVYILQEDAPYIPDEVRLLSNSEGASPSNILEQQQLYQNPEFRSSLNIPFTHQLYQKYTYVLDTLVNKHTAVKPYLYSDIPEKVFDQEYKPFMKPKNTWFGRKLWNEHLVLQQGEDYWFTLDFLMNLQLGKDNSDLSYTYNNTRALRVDAAIGKKFTFSTYFYESQGRFASYYNSYAKSIKPSGGNPAIIPGRGIAKTFSSDSFDYPVAVGYINYRPSKTFNFQFGHGQNFIGDGYRSLFISDVSSPYPYFKINTTFWNIKYTNLWMWLQDVRPEVTVEGAFKRKYMASHYLSWNVSRKLNLGFFESVIWEKTAIDGFNINYLNPVIFYRAIEFSSGSKKGNAVIGLSAKYKWNPDFTLYGQLVIDELTIGEITKPNGYWGNKLGGQFGFKYRNLFSIPKLHIQGECNIVRPYTYSHNTVATNYGHNNQSMAHLWGSNFYEFIGIGTYSYNRWRGLLKVVYGAKGNDFDGEEASYGGDIYKDYEDRSQDYENAIGQGNKSNLLHTTLEASYLLNPSIQLELFSNITYRNYTIDQVTEAFQSQNTPWVSIGIRTNLFNMYSDF